MQWLTSRKLMRAEYRKGGLSHLLFFLSQTSQPAHERSPKTRCLLGYLGFCCLRYVVTVFKYGSFAFRATKAKLAQAWNKKQRANHMLEKMVDKSGVNILGDKRSELYNKSIRNS
jgi:hypothetical protein